MRLPEIRSIFSVMNFCPEAHSEWCNNEAIHNRLWQLKLESIPVLSFQEFLFGEETLLLADDQSPGGALNRYLLIFKRLIFESRVFAGRPSFAAAPPAPEIRPWLSFSAASIISLSCRTRVPPSVAVRDAAGGSSRLNQVSSTAKLSSSERITARSITFCSSRTFPGQPYAWRTFKDFLLIVRNFLPALFPKRSMKYSASKGISATRSRNGGISTGTTLSLYKRSFRNLPSATSAFKSDRKSVV